MSACSALDRLYISEDLTPEDFAVRREAVYRLTAEMEMVEPTWPVLRRAGPTTLEGIQPDIVFVSLARRGIIVGEIDLEEIFARD